MGGVLPRRQVCALLRLRRPVFRRLARPRALATANHREGRPADRQQGSALPARLGATMPLADNEPSRTRERQRAGDEEIEPQAEDVMRGVNAQGLLEDAEDRVAGHVEGKQPRWTDAAMIAEPDQEPGQAEVPNQLVEEGRVGRVALRAVCG